MSVALEPAEEQEHRWMLWREASQLLDSIEQLDEDATDTFFVQGVNETDTMEQLEQLVQDMHDWLYRRVRPHD